MKKFILFLITVFALFIMVGCVKSETIMTINKNKSMDISVTYALDSELYNLASTDGTDDSSSTDSTGLVDKDILTNRGYTAQDYNDGTYIGVKAIKHINNIDTVSASDENSVTMSNFLDSDFNDSVFFTVKRGFFKNTYTAKFVYDLTDTSTSNDDDSFIDMESFIANSIDVSCQVTLPSKPISTNCVLISDDGKTLKWVAKYNAVTDIEYSFEILNTINIIIVSASALIVITAVIVIPLILKKKKINQQ